MPAARPKILRGGRSSSLVPCSGRDAQFGPGLDRTSLLGARDGLRRTRAMRMARAPTPASPWAKTGRSSLSPASDARGKACARSRKAGCGATSMASSPPSRTPRWPPCTRRRCRCAWSRPTSWTWDAGRGEDVAAAAGDGVLAVLIVARTMSPIDPYRPLECPLSDVRFAPHLGHCP